MKRLIIKCLGGCGIRHALKAVPSLKVGTTEGCSVSVSPVQTETPPGNEMATTLLGKPWWKIHGSLPGTRLGL